MRTSALKAFALLSILLFCSCSDDSDTAQVPEIAPVVSQAAEKVERSEPAQPAEILLQSKELFGSMKSKDLEFADDSLLQSQNSFEELDTDGALELEQTDFSQDITR